MPFTHMSHPFTRAASEREALGVGKMRNNYFFVHAIAA